jgi:hypothetical protein
MRNTDILYGGIYSLSFIAIFFVITLQRRDIAKFGLTDQFVWLAVYGLVHGLADIAMAAGQVSPGQELGLFLYAVLAVKAVSYVFLLYFGTTELTKSPMKTAPFLILWVLLLETYLITQGGVALTFRSVGLFFAFPSALIAAVGAYRLALEFKPMHLPVLPAGFFALGSFFALYAFTKVPPMYAVYPQLTPIGQYILPARAFAALGICTSTLFILRAFQK